MTENEQKLALFLGVVLIGGGSFLGYSKLKFWKQRIETLDAEVATRRSEADELLSKQELWEQRSSWLADKQPEFTKPAEAASQLMAVLDELGARHGVTLGPKQINEPRESPGMTCAVTSFEVRGEMKPILNWLYDLQQPANFIVVPSMTISPNEETKTEIILNLRVEKWFRLPPA